MTTRETLVDQFLKTGPWHLAEDREQTERAVREFLLELPEQHFSRLVQEAEVLVLAPSASRTSTSMHYAVSVRVDHIAPDCIQVAKHFQVVDLSAELEKCPYSGVRAVVFSSLAVAFALEIDGLDEGTAAQVGAEAGRAEQRPAGWRTN